MKVRFWIFLPLLCSLAFALDTPKAQQSQEAAPPLVQRPVKSPAPTRQGAARRTVAPLAPVITISGLCPSGQASSPKCKITVTRAQFESLMMALYQRGSDAQPTTAAAKRQFATQYSRMLILAGEAEKQGLQNSMFGKSMLEYARLQALSQVLREKLEAETQPTEEEVKAYYDANQDSYAELTLQRVFIPVHQVEQGKTNEKEMQALADDLYQRAASASDFVALQNEANERADIKNPPLPKIVVPATALPASQKAVLQLKVGEVSQLIKDPAGFFFYRLEAKRPQPLEMATNDIRENLATLKLQAKLDKLVSSNRPQLNPDYFPEASVPGKRNTRGSVTITPQRPARRPMSAMPTPSK